MTRPVFVVVGPLFPLIVTVAMAVGVGVVGVPLAALGVLLGGIALVFVWTITIGIRTFGEVHAAP